MLLLEAGGKDRSPNIKIPAAFANQFHTELDWDYWTEPEPAVDGRSLYIPRGKSLGGSSSMNAMLYVRGRPLDYDLWREQGAPGWGWKDVLPYFLRSEDNVRGASEFHGAGGEMRISEQRSPRPLDRRLLEASAAIGIPRIDDYNGPEQDGASMFQVFQKDGRRWSAADAFLRPPRSARTSRSSPGPPCSGWSSTATGPPACATGAGVGAGDGAGRRGGDPLRRRDRLAADPDALRHRPRRRAARGRGRSRVTSSRASVATSRTIRT